MLLKNPFAIYILAFGGALATYQLGWSELYPKLSLALLAFLGLSFLVMAMLGLVVHNDVAEIEAYRPGQMPTFAVLVLVAVWVADLLYAHQLPMLALIRGSYSYGSFPGIPTAHVFAVTFGGSVATIRFADMLYSRGWQRWRYLAEAMIPIAFFALVNYRGVVVIALVSWGFIYIIKRGGLGLWECLAAAVLGLAALYLFGAYGDVRTGGIEHLGRPSDAFVASGVPRTYFWGYLYYTSPLANLQHTIGTAFPRLDFWAGVELPISEMLPDFLSNRILPMLGTQRLATPEVGPNLNVATIFARSYLYFGWAGVFAMFIYFFSFILIYLRLIRKSPYRVPCLALLNTLVIFCTFDNMIAQTFFVAQLIWPLLLPLLPLRNVAIPIDAIPPKRISGNAAE
jgi:hypothetical protein